MIDFELPERVKQQHAMIQAMAETFIRPVSRELDEKEHEKPWDFIKTVWPVIQMQEGAELAKAEKKAAALAAGEAKPERDYKKKPSIATMLMAHLIEALS